MALALLIGVGVGAYYIVTEFLSPGSPSVQEDPWAATEPDYEMHEPETEAPTETPAEAPTEAPTEPPTEAPTEAPTEPPTEAPTIPQYGTLLYFIEYCDKMYLTVYDLDHLTAAECRILRNACFAKDGRKFNDASLQAYFNQFDWYEPIYEPDSFPKSILNDYQSANITLIGDYEHAKGYR